MNKSVNYFKIIVFTIVIFLVYQFYYVGDMLAVGPNKDIVGHVKFAYQMKDGVKYFLYPLWHIVFLILELFTPTLVAACLANTMFFSISLFVTYYILKKYLESKIDDKYIVLIASVLQFIAPIYFYWLGPMYMSYGATSVWHNPTYLTVKGVSVLFFFYFINIHEKIKQNNVKNSHFVMLGSLALLCYLAKPSFDFTFMPIISVFYVIYFLIKRNKILFIHCLKVAISFVPTLLYAIISSKYMGENGIQIAINPFYVFTSWNVNVFVTLISTFAFPITVLFLLNKENIKEYSSMICFSWVNVIFCFLQYLFLTEAGDRAGHGNFAWGYILSVFIIFISSVIIYIKESKEMVVPQIRLSIATVILVLHVLFGIYYFYLCWSGSYTFECFLPKGSLL